MAEFNPNLWAPWRAEYIRSLSDPPEEMGCFLCDYAAQADHDAENFVVCRPSGVLAVLNRYPYTNGHLLIAPLRHIGDFTALDPDELSALGRLVRDSVAMLERAVGAHGYNVGMNLGRCAGAGLPDHLHWHVVPRWNGDTNFMSTVGTARVIAESLEAVHERLCAAAAEMGLK